AKLPGAPVTRAAGSPTFSTLASSRGRRFGARIDCQVAAGCADTSADNARAQPAREPRSQARRISRRRFEGQQHVARHAHQTVAGLDEQGAVGGPDGKIVDGTAVTFHTV